MGPPIFRGGRGIVLVGLLSVVLCAQLCLCTRAKGRKGRDGGPRRGEKSGIDFENSNGGGVNRSG